MQFTLTINPTCFGKDPKTIGNDSWQQVTNVTPENLLEWAYIRGLAFAPGLFNDAPLKGDDKTHKADTYWTGSELIVIDIDDNNISLSELKSNSFIQQHAVVIFPSSSYAQDNQKWHIVFKLETTIRNRNSYSAMYQYVADSLVLDADKSLKRVSQGVYGTVFNQKSMQEHVKSLSDGLCWINDNAVVVATVSLLSEWVATNHEYVQQTPEPVQYDPANHSENTRDIENEFYEQPDNVQKRVLTEALTYAVSGEWNTLRRNERLPLIMAAHEASNADPDIMQVFLDCDMGRWAYSNQRANLPDWWERHETKDYQVGTVFYYAKRNGWLQYTTTELERYDEISSNEIGDWLLAQDTLPRRLLIKSGTGTGKTIGAIRLLKARGIPKSVFFAPSIKLCYDLSNTLSRRGVTNTLYIKDGRTLDHDTLADANVLVTTLQTFATKVVKREADLSVYEFVVIDESDELISSFVRADVYNTLNMASHVRSYESIHGLKGLFDLLQQAGTVLMLDGTATQLSQQLLERFSAGIECKTIVNTWARDKAQVRISNNKTNVLGILISAAQHADIKHIAVCCDTRSQAHQIEMYLKLEGLATDDNCIVITGDTGHQRKVKDFLADVNGQAKQYRYVIYNSAMGSGVSITSIQPDMTFQFAEWLTPRNLIQILNRYRQQNGVVAYVKPRHSLFNLSARERTVDIKATADYEAELVDLTPVERDTFALTREYLAQMAVDDITQQGRNHEAFYRRLLRGDGRDVVDLEGLYFSEDVKKRLAEARELLRDAKSEAFTSWRSVPPVNYDNPPTADMSVLDVARGRLHAMIEHVVPELNERDIEIDDETIAKVVHKFYRYRHMLNKFLDKDKAMTDTVTNTMDESTEHTAFKLTLSRVEMLHLVGAFLAHTHDERVIEDEKTIIAAYEFIDSVRERKHIYNLMCKGYDQRFHFVMGRFSDPVDRAVALARNILYRIGLSVRRKAGSRDSEGNRQRVVYIRNADSLMTFLHLVRPDMDDTERLTFDHKAFQDWQHEVKKYARLYGKMHEDNDTKGLHEVNTIMQEYDTGVQTALEDWHTTIF